MHVGVLTGGGDCPGLNAVIRAVVRKGVQEHGWSFTGFRDGWRGVVEGDTVPLDVRAVRGILPRGGTVLGSSRTDPFGVPDGVRRIGEQLAKRRTDALIAIGGRGTLAIAARLHAEHGVPCVGVPKTIDNDLSATDWTFGFDTAVGIATQAIDRLHTTADSHRRVLVVEVMGRHTGWIALHAGLAGGANVILVPEQRFDLDQVCAWVASRFEATYAPILVVAEGARPRDGLVVEGSVGVWLAAAIERRTGKEARTTVLGHVQRGGSPSAFDRWLATRFGLHAVDAVRDGAHGTMVALRGTEVVRVPLAAATARLKTVDPALYAEAGVFFG
ncbi:MULTISPECIES: ATP-dependent 6-phosphofructokinase [unclassified Streptomyces]|uniref:ATP-dependent 6-phosphofructokinase n=1 Tax=unclassified Streptomyces TaxID=2593676 RepID=UPI002E300297|nr:ATP-dependent 6-phosphofructokinase [Streptomyces sp. NBC_01268]